MNKKKIFIGLIVILVVFIIVCLVVITYAKHKRIIESDYEIAEIPEENIASENENLDIPMEEIETQENIEIQEPTETKADTTSQEKVSSTVKKQSNSTQTQAQANKETQTKAQVQTTTETIQPTQTQAQIEQSKVTEEKKKAVSPSPSQINIQDTYDEEKRIRNDKMIETMKNIIKNNETEDMRNFGYEIVVDSSITSRTNYFTYTEKRVISKILYRFGTIKIYAEDLYVNGGYAHTECFIY